MQDGESIFRLFREQIDRLMATDPRLAGEAVVADHKGYVEIQWLTLAGALAAVGIGSLLFIVPVGTRRRRRTSRCAWRAGYAHPGRRG